MLSAAQVDPGVIDVVVADDGNIVRHPNREVDQSAHDGECLVSLKQTMAVG